MENFYKESILNVEKPSEGKYQEFCDALSNNKILKCIKIKDCNRHEIFYCINVDQFHQIVCHFFDAESKRARDFYEYCSRQVIYDGLIFGLTKGLLETADKENTFEAKFRYVYAFDSVYGGFRFEVEEMPEKNYFSKYLFDF